MSRKILQAAVVAALALPCTASVAAVDYFLKLEGIPGESKADGHKDEIDIASWSWGAAASSPGAAPRASSRPCPTDISITKLLDKASPLLAGRTTTGTPIAKATLTARKAGEKQQEYLKVELKDLLVTSYQTGGASQSLPMESVSFNFSKMTIEYKEQRADGSVGPSISANIDGC